MTTKSARPPSRNGRKHEKPALLASRFVPSQQTHTTPPSASRPVSPPLRGEPAAAPLGWLLDLLQQALTGVMTDDVTPLQKANAIARLGALYLKAYRASELEQAHKALLDRIAELEQRLAAAGAQHTEVASGANTDMPKREEAGQTPPGQPNMAPEKGVGQVSETSEGGIAGVQTPVCFGGAGAQLEHPERQTGCPPGRICTPAIPRSPWLTPSACRSESWPTPPEGGAEESRPGAPEHEPRSREDGEAPGEGPAPEAKSGSP